MEAKWKKWINAIPSIYRWLILALLIVVVTIGTIVIVALSKGDSKNDSSIVSYDNESDNDSITGKDEDDNEETTKKNESSTEKETNNDETTSQSQQNGEGAGSLDGNYNQQGAEGGSQVDTNQSNSNTNNNSSSLASVEAGVNMVQNANLIAKRVTVHDPSIEYNSANNNYYIFGSHLAWAKTSDLINWSMVSNNVSSSYSTIFSKNGTWSAHGSANYNISGNMWAPDVFYNSTMKKWCMYMSVNGDNHFSSIAMATADSIDGPYTYAGTVVYSGFYNSALAAETDFATVTGSNTVPSRYISENIWNSEYGTNAIDPCVFTDKDGQIWMTYGSWFGGIFLLKLSNTTGLRDYSYTYTTTTNKSDEYMGYRISGGYGCTGEGSYIVWDAAAGYYYLYLSYDGLNATDNFANYHMRLFRSKNVTGPYVDSMGNGAICTMILDNQTTKGVKLMGNYYFSSFANNLSSDNSYRGYMSGGHNSAIIDNNGNHFLIYHTRFNLLNEWHAVRVHQQFLNEDGWLVTAPYEYLGSTISTNGYSSDKLVGTYEMINHGTNADNRNTGILQTYYVKLNADGSITAEDTKIGTWQQKANSYYATIVMNGITYKGVFFEQYDESKTHNLTMTFSVIGNNDISLWGSKVLSKGVGSSTETGKLVAGYSFNNAASLGASTSGSNNATVYGATSASDATRGKVLSFDGNDDYVKVPASATNSSTGLTVMMWAKAKSVSNWARIFDFGASIDNYMFFTVSNGTNYRYASKYDGKGEDIINGRAKFSTNTWVHIAVTVSKNRIATLYINGKIVGIVPVDASIKTIGSSANYLGKSQFTDPYFSGYMDDVRIYNYALSITDVNLMMNTKM